MPCAQQATSARVSAPGLLVPGGEGDVVVPQQPRLFPFRFARRDFVVVRGFHLVVPHLFVLCADVVSPELFLRQPSPCKLHSGCHRSSQSKVWPLAARTSTTTTTAFGRCVHSPPAASQLRVRLHQRPCAPSRCSSSAPHTHTYTHAAANSSTATNHHPVKGISHPEKRAAAQTHCFNLCFVWRLLLFLAGVCIAVCSSTGGVGSRSGGPRTRAGAGAGTPGTHVIGA